MATPGVAETVTSADIWESFKDPNRWPADRFNVRGAGSPRVWGWPFWFWWEPRPG